MHSTKNIHISKFVITIGIITTILCLAWWLKIFIFLHVAEEKNGTVQSIEVDWDSESDPAYYPIIQFQDDAGKNYTFRPFTTFQINDFQKNEAVTVLFESQHPEKAVLKHWAELYFLPGLLLLSSIQTLIAGIIIKTIQKRASIQQTQTTYSQQE